MVTRVFIWIKVNLIVIEIAHQINGVLFLG